MIQATKGLNKAEKRLIQRNKARELAQMEKERQKDRELYNTDEFNRLPDIKELIEAIKLPNKIELLEEEDNVIRSFLRHGSVNKITTDLKKKYPDMVFYNKDVKEFLFDYQDAIKKQVEIKSKSAVRRMMKTKEGLTNELLDLAELSKTLAIKYDNADDHSSAIAAIKAAADIFYRNAKIEGILDESTTINVTTQLDKMVQNVASESSSFKDAVLNIVEKSKQNDLDIIEAEFEEIPNAENGKE